jgi:hypothetical protein
MKRCKRLTDVVCPAVLLALVGGFLHSASWAQDTVVASRDCRMQLDLPTTNLDHLELSVADWDGSPTSLTRSSVISFDLSTYTSNPNFVEFTSVVLRLGEPTGGNGGSPLHKVNRLLRDFVESEVTYNDYSSGNAWEAPGALGASDSVEVATGVIGGDTGIEWSGIGLDVTAIANAWAGAPDTTQLGFLIYADNKFFFRTYGNTESAAGPGPGPVLEVEAQTGIIIGSTDAVVDDVLGTSFSSVSNSTYRLQSTPDLVSSNFSDTGAFAIGNGGDMTLFDPTGPSTSKNYRVKQE